MHNCTEPLTSLDAASYSREGTENHSVRSDLSLPSAELIGVLINREARHQPMQVWAEAQDLRAQAEEELLLEQTGLENLGGTSLE